MNNARFVLTVFRGSARYCVFVAAVVAGLSMCSFRPAFAVPSPPSYESPPARSDSIAVRTPTHPHRIPLPPADPAYMSAHYRAVAMFKADSIPHDYIALGSVRGYVYILRKKMTGFADVWTTFYLGSPIKKIVAEDLENNGTIELVIVTSAGKMFVFDTGTRQLVWENTSNDFDTVSEFLIDQVDPDPAKELILCADSRLLVMDGAKFLREYQSADELNAEYMVIGDVDNDDEKEIVLDSGYVINARTLNIEWQTDYFGTRPTLVDVDDDGIPELICESTGGGLRLYDLDIRQEKVLY